MRRILLVLVLVSVIGAGAFAAPPATTLRWLGHSCFLVTSPEGKKLLIDPFAKLAYPPPAVKADVVLVTHEHLDHNNVAVVKGSPVVIRGLKNDGKDWNSIDRIVAGFKIKSFPSYHDTKKGAQRGKNTIFLINIGGLRLVHLGDLGHILPESTVRAIGRVDALMIPVGGHFTIGPEKACKVVGQLKPKLILPMHYKTSVVKLPIKPVSEFTSTSSFAVKNLSRHTVPLKVPNTPKVWVFPMP